ncbi:HPF/RaiA family ribosome-associated protein [Bythopirellula goksoeyrii]|uniref:Sigma 54 modulation protein / S30EA ribosomal protein n=1 Tax=Bythopirellula goksoeyrii TaxID=1400387 RepID=A0A5B9QH81_9BACT|nr:HPF/RaiA family ribosome-associated protein [Bythopirellula goksoeyrii]QEG36326.1 hypothetical protein Pr1d_36390 [Bythopirellula goksoeyrii]
MRLSTRFKGIDRSGNLQSLIERRIYFALSRFSPRVTSVSVVVEDINGDRGGIDKRCQISIKLDRKDELRVDATHADVEGAVSLAANRAGRIVQRKLELWRSAQRQCKHSQKPTEQYDDVIPTD